MVLVHAFNTYHLLLLCHLHYRNWTYANKQPLMWSPYHHILKPHINVFLNWHPLSCTSKILAPNMHANPCDITTSNPTSMYTWVFLHMSLYSPLTVPIIHMKVMFGIVVVDAKILLGTITSHPTFALLHVPLWLALAWFVFPHNYVVPPQDKVCYYIEYWKGCG